MRVVAILYCYCSLLSVQLSAQVDLLQNLIKDGQADFGEWAQDPGRYEVQIIYTQIDRDAAGQPHFTQHTFGIDSHRYFYPASTVKMPAAFLALEKINQLSILGLDAWTPLRIGAASQPQTPVVTDPTAEQLLPSVAHYIKKIFLVSDNDAYNRLYEFLGQGYANAVLQRKGYRQARLIHRLSAPAFGPEENRLTNPITFYQFDTMLYHQGEVYSTASHSLQLTHEQRGKGYHNSADELVAQPFDFGQKNFFALQELHDILLAVMFPAAVPEKRRFDLTDADYRYLYRVMSQLPQESRYPNYADKSDNYVKFWLYGDRDTSIRIPSHIRIFNKVGWAYGFLTDVAYIVDLKRGIEFFLAGSIHVNANQIYNDGQYEYESIGLPLFGELGRAIYDLERKRKRAHPAQLDRFRELKYE